MPPPRVTLRIRRACAALPAAALLAAAPLAAQGPPLPGEPGFPPPFWAALLAMVVCGATGALAADLVTDGGRLERWKDDAQGWTLGALGKLIVGSVAAVVLLTLNPAGPSWPPLLGTALLAGLGAEGVLLAAASARKAQEAEAARQAAERRAARMQAAGAAKLETLRALTRSGGGADLLLPALRIAGGGEDDGAPGDGSPAAGLHRVLDTYAERARAELAALR